MSSPLTLRNVGGAVGDLFRTRGGAVRELDALLRSRFEADEVVLLHSGTAALEVAIRAVRREAGDTGPVALPAFCCFDVATAAIGAEVPVRFYDIDPVTLSPDPDSLREALEEGSRCVVVAHLYGVPIDWGRVRSLADEFDAMVIEDAAQGHGATLGGRPLGTLGRVSVVSFGRGKGWTGCGGGAVMARGLGGSFLKGVAPVAPASALAAPKKVAAALGHAVLRRPDRLWIPAAVPWLHIGETVYHPPVPPRGMHPASAALALRSRPLADAAAAGRRMRGRMYAECIPFGRHIARVPTQGGAEPGYLRYPILLRSGLAGLGPTSESRRLGIETSYPLPLPRLPQIEPFLEAPTGEFSGAERLVRELVTLPTHDDLDRHDVELILQRLERHAGPVPIHDRGER